MPRGDVGLGHEAEYRLRTTVVIVVPDHDVGGGLELVGDVAHDDAEARVIGHSRGAGKHAGRLGALEVELADGTRFSVGTGLSDDERRAPPPLGTIITFRYQELSEAGVPRFPSYVGVRDDAALAPLPKPAPASAPSAPAAGPAPAPAAGSRRFECVEGGSAKFWEIAVEGTGHSVRFGRIGSAGQQKSKTFSDEAAAHADAARLIAEKAAKGYVEKP